LLANTFDTRAPSLIAIANTVCTKNSIQKEGHAHRKGKHGLLLYKAFVTDYYWLSG